MLQRRVYHSMAAVQRKLYVLGGNDLDYNNDRILVRHIDSYNIDTDQWTRCNFNLLTGKYLWLSQSGREEIQQVATLVFLYVFTASLNTSAWWENNFLILTRKVHIICLTKCDSQMISLVFQGLRYFLVSSHLVERGLSSHFLAINIHTGTLTQLRGTRELITLYRSNLSFFFLFAFSPLWFILRSGVWSSLFVTVKYGFCLYSPNN